VSVVRALLPAGLADHQATPSGDRLLGLWDLMYGGVGDINCPTRRLRAPQF
jgi:hypothetical protein